MVELNNFEYLRHIVLSYYQTFSGLALERWFRLKMMESHQYSDIGSWWERKRGKETNEIDIVALSTDGENALVADVKRQQRNYNHKAFMEKVDCLKTTILSKYKIKTRLFTLADM